MKYIVKNINSVPYEGTHDLPNSRQTLISPDELISKNFQAFTKGILEVGQVWDWHAHDEHYEFFTVLKGTGTIEFEDSTKHNYVEGDIVLINPKFKHRIIAEGSDTSEFFFVRLL
jgi:quercetin dioxygenase-like cupin family protein